MMTRTWGIKLAGSVEFDMSAEYVRDRSVRQKSGRTRRAFPVRGLILDQQPARQQKVARKEDGGSFVVKSDMRGFVARRRNDVDDAPAQVEARRAIRPGLESEEGAHRREIRRHDLHARRRRE